MRYQSHLGLLQKQRTMAMGKFLIIIEGTNSHFDGRAVTSPKITKDSNVAGGCCPPIIPKFHEALIMIAATKDPLPMTVETLSKHKKTGKWPWE
jgi:hypothetical protein